MPTKNNKIAYCAGLYEGEGNLNIGRFYYKNGQKFERKTSQYQLRIGMTDHEPLEKFQECFGGKILGPYWGVKRTMPIFTYSLWGKEAVLYAITSMWPYLSPRRKSQLEHVLTGGK